MKRRNENGSVRMPRANRYVFGFLAGLAIAVGLGVTVAAATTWYVNDGTGNDLNNCTSPLTPCKTIQAAINKASNGDTINVAAGMYLELAAGPLTVNKTLTLLGAQAGIDARVLRGAESIINDVQGTSVSASGVVIDGFTVQASSVAAFTGYGIWLNPGISGTQILNNIIQDNIAGIGLANNGAQATIRHNWIRNNILPGGASGSGIYTDEFVGGPIVGNVLIEENSFTGHSGSGGAINISNTDFANGGVFALEVSTNSFDMNSRAFVLFNTHDSTFHDNTITNSTFLLSADVRLFDNNTGLLFTDNDLRDGVGHAIRFSVLFALPSSDVEFHQNNIGTVGNLSYALTGLTVDPASHAGSVDATCNWWGSSTGPTNLNNPGGTGEEVVGDANFTPWLLAPAPGGPCKGGVPSTPGKVTGGGQIGSDPVFSPLGDLISLPALIPSLANPAAQASFGFIAKCCAPSGNLEYNDHQAEVRIKAQTVDGLFISNVACTTTTGKHATFTGIAAVIQPTGTTTERYTVDVDDCGEPGTEDTFGIKTTTYANGPTPLIAGNIQIHK
jgi:hypothetical protein